MYLGLTFSDAKLDVPFFAYVGYYKVIIVVDAL